MGQFTSCVENQLALPTFTRSLKGVPEDVWYEGDGSQAGCFGIEKYRLTNYFLEIRTGNCFGWFQQTVDTMKIYKMELIEDTSCLCSHPPRVICYTNDARHNWVTLNIPRDACTNVFNKIVAGVFSYPDTTLIYKGTGASKGCCASDDTFEIYSSHMLWTTQQKNMRCTTVTSLMDLNDQSVFKGCCSDGVLTLVNGIHTSRFAIPAAEEIYRKLQVVRQQRMYAGYLGTKQLEHLQLEGGAPAAAPAAPQVVLVQQPAQVVYAAAPHM